MADLTITFEDGFGDHGIFPRKTISVNGKSKPAPSGVIPIDRLEPDEEVYLQSRGINEIHTTIHREKLLESSGKKSKAVLSHVNPVLKENSYEDEITFIFTTYTETEEIEKDGEVEKTPKRMRPDEAECIVKTLSPLTDILPIPMFRELQYAVDEDLGTADPHFRMYLQSVITFLNHVEQHASQTPVMGVLPGRLPWDCLESLFEIYEAFDVNAFHLNLDRLKFTAEAQMGMIEQLMKHVADLELEEKSLFYLINGERGQYDADIGAFPAADIAALGFGFDIIGGRRVPPRMDFEEVDIREDTFKIFDREHHVYSQELLRNLHGPFPKKSGFEDKYVVRQSRDNPLSDRYRLQALVNAEQLSLAVMDYRKEDPGKPSPEYFRNKTGVTNDIGEQMRNVKKTFDTARFATASESGGQSGLDDF